MKRFHLSAIQAGLTGFFIAFGLPILAAELYPATRQPGNGVNWTTTVSLVSSAGVPVALASGDTEISCEGGAFADATEATSAGDGIATITYDASTNSNCEFGTIQVKGTNHVTSVATVHFVTDYSLVYVGTASGYDDTTPSGCDAGGASITLNTADQTGSATDGTYNGMWVQPSDGTGGNQNGRWASTAYTYDGTNKILCVDYPFVTDLDATSVIQIYSGYARTPITINETGGVVEASVAGLEQHANLDAAFLNCTVNTANFAGSSTTLACILTDRDGGAVSAATGDLEGLELRVTSGTQIYEGRFIEDTTWDAGNSELQITLSRALPGTLADAVTAIIR
jgi:hypothetical protein